MNTLLITYDLIAPNKDYDKLWSFLEEQDDWAKPVRSVYFIRTTQSAENFRNSVKKYIDGDDKVLVINVTDDAAAWSNLGDKINNWIKNNL